MGESGIGYHFTKLQHACMRTASSKSMHAGYCVSYIQALLAVHACLWPHASQSESAEGRHCVQGQSQALQLLAALEGSFIQLQLTWSIVRPYGHRLQWRGSAAWTIFSATKEYASTWLYTLCCSRCMYHKSGSLVLLLLSLPRHHSGPRR